MMLRVRCAIDGCPEEGRYDVGLSVVVCTSTSTVETALLVCIEHCDEYGAGALAGNRPGTSTRERARSL
jgi:hypothetical protein